MVSAMGTFMVDTYATSYYKKSHLNKAGRDEEMVVDGHVHVHTHATHDHAHGSILFVGDSDSSELLRYRVISQVLELEIIVHSVIIGISLGASETPKTIRPLVAALTFHQFFEGMGLGGCMAQENNPTALIVEGVLNAASAGILICMALVDLLSADFMNLRMQNNGQLQLKANASLLFGAGFMSLLAKWA
ncbi:unnamed protein product [Ilex paraguariensis]|uniref:Uncharacterized protein n=1 Tax=Ilex paraguariensis TaxID=185542 RepID=A0ABC8U8I4_9AQUA